MYVAEKHSTQKQLLWVVVWWYFWVECVNRNSKLGFILWHCHIAGRAENYTKSSSQDVVT